MKTRPMIVAFSTVLLIASCGKPDGEPGERQQASTCVGCACTCSCLSTDTNCVSLALCCHANASVPHSKGACGEFECSYDCVAGYKLCAGACIPNATCCIAADCTSPPSPTCQDTAGTCPVAGEACVYATKASHACCGANCTTCCNPVNGSCDGSCALTCSAGYTNCDANVANGCEQLQDATHCGAGCLSCSTGNLTSPTCTSGVCGGTCNANYVDCDGNKQTNGCEINTTSGDVANCGGCNIACSANHIAAACAAGSCNGGVCAGGYADCNGNKQTDGCEINTASGDVANCGGCGTVCSANHIAAACSGSSCNAGVCATGYADCNANKQSDGCEINTASDVANCGTCGHVCPAVGPDGVASCVAGQCSAACSQTAGVTLKQCAVDAGVACAECCGDGDCTTAPDACHAAAGSCSARRCVYAAIACGSSGADLSTSPSSSTDLSASAGADLNGAPASDLSGAVGLDSGAVGPNGMKGASTGGCALAGRVPGAGAALWLLVGLSLLWRRQRRSLRAR